MVVGGHLVDLRVRVTRIHHPDVDPPLLETAGGGDLVPPVAGGLSVGEDDDNVLHVGPVASCPRVHLLINRGNKLTRISIN